MGSDDSLTEHARKVLLNAKNYAADIAKPDGHWVGEVYSNATFTAEYVFLRQSLGLSFEKDGDRICSWLLSDQQPNGSWSISPGYDGDPSTTTEAYLALKILNFPVDDPAMARARDFMRSAGGIEKVRNFTRLFLATFGLFPWSSVPQLPSELILMPASSPINIYTLSSWARSTSIPLLTVRHFEPIFALPNGRSKNNDYLDELWCNPRKKNVSYTKSMWNLLSEGDFWGFTFTAADKMMYYLDIGIRHTPLRAHSRQVIIKWILDHQEKAGDWAGYIPPMWGSVMALYLEGFKVDDDPIRLGLEAIERLACDDKNGKRVQATVSPVWDTVLMSIGLCDSGFVGDENLQRAIDWVKPLQQLGPEGDWRVYNPTLEPGGWSFEYFNSWFPDVDDTACAILALLKHDSDFVTSSSIHVAVRWILGMQNADGGWAAFDHENNNMFLNKIPFSDMNSLCDPSTADVTGRILECFGHITGSVHVKGVDSGLVEKMRISSIRAIAYLQAEQEEFGPWWGRWGCNYIYGTSNVLCGLRTYCATDTALRRSLDRAIVWLKEVQNDDGGWGEGVESYDSPSLAGRGVSTPSQTAWGIMALLAYLPHSDPAIVRAVRWLVSSQSERSETGATWPESVYTATGFPKCLYLEYSLYPHYFPMMALGRYVKEVEDMASANREKT